MQERVNNPWINVYNSKANQKQSYPENIDLVDVDADQENLLIIAEFNKSLSFFRGENLDW